jgi:hypothetical protein
MGSGVHHDGMDPLAFFIAHVATRKTILGAEPWDGPPPHRRRRPDNRAGRVRT